MILNENQHDPHPRRPLAALVLVAGALALGAALTGTSGCGKAPTGVKDEKAATVQGDPWKVAGQRLKRDTDWAACRSALGGLATELHAQQKDPLPVLTDAEFAQLAELVPLSPADREEVRGTTFSPHDGAYLADCLYLRDAARSLALTGLPPDQQAERAFAWVCREVYLHPWTRITGTPDGGAALLPTALPPTAVLRRGSGSGLERMYVFLALLQQLDLDGCLIGAPDAGTQPAGLPVLTPDKKAYATGAPRGPFWAVGVRTGADVKLFDPWRGQSFPVTLAQLKANPGAATAWFADPVNVSGATLDDAKKATAFLAVPVSALAPRMAAVESKLKTDLAAKVFFNAKALRDPFPDPKPAFWNPPDEPALPFAFSYGRAARAFLPLDMGGTDRGADGSRLFDEYLRSQIPASVIRVPGALAQDAPAAGRLRTAAAAMLGVSFIVSPNPRERIQRGLFQDAAKDLVAKQDTFASGLERLRLNKDADQEVEQWVETVNGLYLELGTAKIARDDAARGKGNAAEAATRLAGAQAAVDEHWKLNGARYLLDRLSSEVGLAEATFLLALCKHELAEQGQTRQDRATGAEADRLRPDTTDSWNAALAAWRAYRQLASAHAGFPGRAAHAQALAARAERFANPPKK